MCRLVRLDGQTQMLCLPGASTLTASLKSLPGLQLSFPCLSARVLHQYVEINFLEVRTSSVLCFPSVLSLIKQLEVSLDFPVNHTFH